MVKNHMVVLDLGHLSEASLKSVCVLVVALAMLHGALKSVCVLVVALAMLHGARVNAAA
jgi:hypothetical protein